MYVVEFCKENEEGEDYNRVFVFDFKELLALLNYIDKFEYELTSVHKEDIFIGYETFKDFVKEYVEKGEEDAKG
jgi:hypothetical protein